MMNRANWAQPIAERGRELLKELQRRLRGQPERTPELRFRCNLCGTICTAAPEELQREVRSCSRCGSTMRWRAMVAALSKELFGTGLAIPDFPYRPDLKGLGLSDEFCYATPLATKLGYTNTFYDAEPRFDIMRIGQEHIGRYDFILSSDVFEHVPPPAVQAFENARRILRPGGVLVFSVPYRLEGDTREHFPELFDYEIVKQESDYVLKNRTKDGRSQEFRELVFHGGPGFTLEMRVFSLKGIEDCVRAAGFQRLEIYDEDQWEFGLCWQGARWGHVMAARV
jgi:SAM-dependent methyltransferase